MKFGNEVGRSMNGNCWGMQRMQRERIEQANSQMQQELVQLKARRIIYVCGNGSATKKHDQIRIGDDQAIRNRSRPAGRHGPAT